MSITAKRAVFDSIDRRNAVNEIFLRDILKNNVQCSSLVRAYTPDVRPLGRRTCHLVENRACTVLSFKTGLSPSRLLLKRVS